MSNEGLVTASQTPGGSSGLVAAGGMHSSMPAKKPTTLRWVTTTPFGRPVEPEV